MGLFKKNPPAPPPPPSPERIAQTDARFNRIDQFTPFGNLTFSGDDRNVATLAFNPAIQQAFNNQLGVDNSLLQLAQTAIGTPGGQSLGGQAFGGAPGAGGSPAGSKGVAVAPGVTGTPPAKGSKGAVQTPPAPSPGASGGTGIAGLIENPLSTSGLPDLQFSLNTPRLNNLPGVGLQRDVGSLDFSGLPGLPDSAEAFRDEVTNAFFDRTSGLLNRQFDRNENRLRQRLANQGFQAGSEGFSQELGDFDIQRNEAFSRLANEATLFGGREASRSLADQLALRGTGTGEALSQFGAGIQEAGFENQAGLGQFGVFRDVINQGNQNALLDFQNQAFTQDRSNTARSQLFNEQAALRGNQFNELASLLGLQQVQPPGLNNFFSPGQTNVNDAFALQQAALNNAFNVNSQRASSAKGATANLLGTLGGGFLGRSLPNPFLLA